jgi:peptidoglycan L-alanyl-D-glutamate endopeptidase CwlK
MRKYINVKSTLNLRKRPVDGLVIANLQNGTEVEVIQECNGWAHVEVIRIGFPTLEGYVSSDYLTSPQVRDKVTEERIKFLHPKIRDEVKALITKAEQGFPANIAVRVAQGLRTFEEQNALYAQGRTKSGSIITNAKGGQSYHNYGLAIDFCLLLDKDGNGTYDQDSWDIKKDNDKDGTADWLEVVRVFEAAGYEWGGKWSSIKDYPHVQKLFGYNWKELLEKYNKKDFIEGKYVKI